MTEAVGRRDLTDPNDTWWTIDQAAAHLGVERASILRYIREGLTAYGTQRMLRRDDVLSEYRRRRQRERSSRARSAE